MWPGCGVVDLSRPASGWTLGQHVARSESSRCLGTESGYWGFGLECAAHIRSILPREFLAAHLRTSSEAIWRESEERKRGGGLRCLYSALAARSWCLWQAALIGTCLPPVVFAACFWFLAGCARLLFMPWQPALIHGFERGENKKSVSAGNDPRLPPWRVQRAQRGATFLKGGEGFIALARWVCGGRVDLFCSDIV